MLTFTHGAASAPYACCISLDNIVRSRLQIAFAKTRPRLCEDGDALCVDTGEGAGAGPHVRDHSCPGICPVPGAC